MWIAKNNDLIILANNNREELEQALQFMNYTSIEETDINYILHNGQYLTEAEIAEQERQRIAMLNLTGADVERGIYKAKRMDFEDIIEYLMVNPLDGLDVKALKIELKANNFFRGNPYVEAVGKFLGFTSEQLDKFFETNDYTYLITTEQVTEQVEDTSEQVEDTSEQVEDTSEQVEVENDRTDTTDISE